MPNPNDKPREVHSCGCGCGAHGALHLETGSLQSWESAPDDAIVCHCSKVDKRAVIATIQNGAFTAPLVKVLTGIGRGRPCPNNHGCLEDLEILLKLYGQTTLVDALLKVDEDTPHPVD